MSLFNFFAKFKNNKADLKFLDTSNSAIWKNYPPVLAKNLKPVKDHQVKKYGDYRFVNCPGIHDYSRLGYIIPAWTRMYFKGNKAGCKIITGGRESSKTDTDCPQPKRMSVDITDGVFDFSDVPPNSWNIASPWRIDGSENLSAIILPAFYHNKYLNDALYIYPGLVDYENSGFTSINLICSIHKKCEFTIAEGEPLLHVIPFKVDEINAEYGLANEKEKLMLTNQKHYYTSNFYRRFYLIKKKFNLSPRDL
jgi:hypothetical protein